MTDLGQLRERVPALVGFEPAEAYRRLSYRDPSGESAADADLEWVDGLFQVAITERSSGRRTPILAAVFDAGSGALLKAGATVSQATPIESEATRDRVLEELVEHLRQLEVVTP